MSIFVCEGEKSEHITRYQFDIACPSCHVHSHLSPLSIPRFNLIAENRPKKIAVVFACDACHAPVVIEFAKHKIWKDHVEMWQPSIASLATAKKTNSNVERYFRQAEFCLEHGQYDAFLAMCRYSIGALFELLGSNGKLQVFNDFRRVASVIKLSEDVFNELRTVIFDLDSHLLPTLHKEHCEVLKLLIEDIIAQNLTRPQKLRAAAAKLSKKGNVVRPATFG